MSGLVIPVFYAMLKLITYFVVGFSLRRFNLFSSEFFRNTGRFVVRIALPFYYFVRLSAVNIDEILSALFFPAAAIILLLLTLGISAAVMSVTGFQGRTKRVGIGLATFGNSSLLPLFFIEVFPLSVPLIETTFGINTPLLYLGAFTIVQSPMLWALGNYLVAGSIGKPKLKEFISPPIFGVLAGLISASMNILPYLQDHSLPFYYIYSSLENIGLTIFPLMIICLGAAIADTDRHKEISKKNLYSLAFSVALVRLLIIPALFIALYFFFIVPLNFSPAYTWILFLQMHIPPGTSLSIMAIQKGINEAQTSFTIMVTYVMYLFLLPIYMLILLSLPGVL
ncbi:MAG: AEC family transporter [Spirochaetia bacterium]|nr:AEC family transporter [Spirochaetia bacterium]MCF7945314.1 AEC family transporter [Spirochaetia bacterium]MCF7946597.1 AEC family transporter [Spirochaetia bacterium]